MAIKSSEKEESRWSFFRGATLLYIPLSVAGLMANAIYNVHVHSAFIQKVLQQVFKMFSNPDNMVGHPLHLGECLLVRRGFVLLGIPQIVLSSITTSRRIVPVHFATYVPLVISVFLDLDLRKLTCSCVPELPVLFKSRSPSWEWDRQLLHQLQHRTRHTSDVKRKHVLKG